MSLVEHAVWLEEFVGRMSEDVKVLRQCNAELRGCLAACAEEMAMEWSGHPLAAKARALVAAGDPLA